MQRRILASLAVLAAALVWTPNIAAAQSPGSDYFPNLPVVTQDGKTVRFYDDLIKGKIVVISFIFTSCTDFCPLTTARMLQVEDKLGDVVGRDIFFYSITVDPENDTPEKLKEYAQAYSTGPGWRFVHRQAGGHPDYPRQARRAEAQTDRAPQRHRDRQ
jgi:cytochrome oxidase Cu insertion factor (SCO1/SenC/PrrC family)